jgi:ubiquinone/menaquinone biosynthesis C-methylase UbiE
MSDQKRAATDPSSVGVKADANLQASSYAMGFTNRERERLMLQGTILREPTAATFRAAGIVPGMRVLDLGSGAGDVAMLAADLVGPTGSVFGLDRDADSVAWATQRVTEAGYTNIRFQVCEFNEFAHEFQFDALVGRCILLYLRDPATLLIRLSAQLRSGGIIAFFEPDFTVLSVALPDVPLFRQCEQWLVAVLRASGASVDMGMRLHQTYRAAGFVKACSMVSHLSGCGLQPGLATLYSETIRSVLPKIVQHNIASSIEVEIDTLGDRFEAAVRAADPQWVGIRYIGAWASKP